MVLELSILRWSIPLQLIKLSWRSFLVACQALWIFALDNTPPHRIVSMPLITCKEKHGNVPRCGGISFMHKFGAFHMRPTRSVLIRLDFFWIPRASHTPSLSLAGHHSFILFFFFFFSQHNINTSLTLSYHLPPTRSLENP